MPPSFNRRAIREVTIGWIEWLERAEAVFADRDRCTVLFRSAEPAALREYAQRRVLNRGHDSILWQRGIDFVRPSMNPTREIPHFSKAGSAQLLHGAATARAGSADNHGFARAIQRRQRFAERAEGNEPHIRNFRDIQLMRLAHVDQVDVVAATQPLGELRRRDLGNLIRVRHGHLRSHSAELIVVDELSDLVRPARRAIRVLAKPNGSKAHAQRVDQQQPANEWLAHTENELDAFRGLDRTDEPRQNAEHTTFRAARHESWRRRFGEETAIARSLLEREHRGLPFEPEDRSIHVGLAEQDARIVREVASRKVVGAVDHDVVITNDVERVLGGQACLVGLDMHMWIHVANALDGRFELRTADILRPVQHLPLEIRDIDDIEVHETERANARCREIQRERRAKAAGTDEQNAAGLELSLTIDPDIGKN